MRIIFLMIKSEWKKEDGRELHKREMRERNCYF